MAAPGEDIVGIRAGSVAEWFEANIDGAKGPLQFELLAGQEDLTLYEFNTRTAKHQFCRVCGIHPFYVPRSDPDKIDVNVRCLEGVDPDRLEAKPFDGENWEQAIGSATWK